MYNSMTSLGAVDPYNKWRLGATGAYSIRDDTVQVAIAAGGKLGSDPLPAYDQFQWGGFLRQSGYATGQLVGASLQYGQVTYYHRLIRGGIFDGAFAGVSLEAGRYGSPLVPGNPSGLLKSMAVFIGADSAVGPVYFGYGRAADGPGSFYFYLGRPL